MVNFGSVHSVQQAAPYFDKAKDFCQYLVDAMRAHGKPLKHFFGHLQLYMVNYQYIMNTDDNRFFMLTMPHLQVILNATDEMFDASKGTYIIMLDGTPVFGNGVLKNTTVNGIRDGWDRVIDIAESMIREAAK